MPTELDEAHDALRRVAVIVHDYLKPDGVPAADTLNRLVSLHQHPALLRAQGVLLDQQPMRDGSH